MEWIKQALDRARDERGHSSDANSRQAQKPSRGSHVKAPAEQKVVYSQSRRLNISVDHLRQNRVISGLSDPIVQQYNMLRTHVVQRMRANNWRSLAITSPIEGAGKTLTAINLAISLAREVNHTVLLVDLDLKRPRIRQYFSDEDLPGISDYLIEDAALADLFFNPGVERLVVLPGHKSLIHSSEMLSSPKVVSLVDDLKNRYPARIVLFDLPPVLACDDVLAFSPYFDSVLLVAEEGGTSKADLKRSIELLEKTEIIGTVLNKSRYNKQGYSYY